MCRVLIIGAPGSGKSTLSTRLAARLGIPVHYLDHHHWLPGWQYLQPTRKHHEVVRFVPPDEFKAYETIAYAKGFLMVSASPLTRSSHHAGDDFARLKAARASRA